MATIFFGLGGIGTGSLLRVKKKMEEKEHLKKRIGENVFFYGFDIQADYDVSKIKTDINRCPGLELENPNSVINKRWDDNEDFRKWWVVTPDKKPWQSPGPLVKDREAGRIRLNGKLLFYYYYNDIKNYLSQIKALVASIKATEKTGEKRADTIFIVSSLGGGTGAGMLIDFTFLVRSMFADMTDIFGVAIDGTVTEKFAPGSGEQSIAALVEIEKWMAKPEEFKMHYSGGELPPKNEKFSKFFDAILLVQYYNKGGRCFLGSKTGQISDDYKELVAEFLYPFAISGGDIMSDLSNQLNKTESLPLINNLRVVKYGSFGISSIVFPYKDILRRATDRIIKENFIDENKLQKPNLPHDTVNFIHQIDIPDDIKDLETDKYREINTRLNNSTGTLKNSKKREIIDDIKNANLHRFDIWRDMFSSYDREVEEKIYEENGILDKIKKGLKEKIQDEIPTLHFEEIRRCLVNLEGYIKKNKEKIEIMNLVIPEDVELSNALTNLDNEIAKKVFSKWKVYKDEFISLFTTFVENSLKRVQNKHLAQLYGMVIKYVQSLKRIIDFIGEVFRDIFDDYSKRVAAQTFRSTLFDKNRWDSGDYPLTLEVRTSDIEKKCQKIIEKNFDIKRVQSLLENGKDTFHSARKIFDIVYKELYEQSKENIKTEINEEIIENVKKLFSFVLEEKAEETLYNITVWDALEWYMDSIYKRVSSAGEVERELIKTEIALDFSEASANFLVDDSNLSDESAWKKSAIFYLIKRFLDLTVPFYKVDEGDIQKIRSTINESDLLTFKSLRRFYSPQYKYSEGLKTHLTDIPEQKYNFDDPHQITIVGMEFVTALFALKNLNILNRRYQDHLESFKQYGGAPAHTDMRFYSEWKDNIMLEEPIISEKNVEAYILYTLGIGIGKIKRENRKFIYGGKTIATTLPKLIDRLESAKKAHLGLKKSIRTDIDSEIEQMIAGKDDFKKINEIQDIFWKGYKFHLKMKPVAPYSPEYELWSKIEEKIKVSKSSDGILTECGDLVPRNMEDGKFEKIIKILSKYK